MKLKVTVNLGNYENIGLESSEHFSIDDCRAELANALAVFHEPRVDDFRKRMLITEA